MKNAIYDLYRKEGVLQVYEARAILDASGTWGNPNPANSNGIWLKEEKSLNEHIFMVFQIF